MRHTILVTREIVLGENGLYAAHTFRSSIETMASKSSDFANWSGLVACQPVQIRAVASLDDVRGAIADAETNSWSIRTAGTTHSHSNLLLNDHGLILLTDDLSGDPAVDAGSATATIPAGTKLHALGPRLWDAGFSLANQGDIDVQSIAGLIGTGVHGTGKSLRSISDAVVGATLVTAEGDVVSTDDDPEILEAVRLNLGVLGVVLDVTLSLVPAYYLHEKAWVEPLPSVMERH